MLPLFLFAAVPSSCSPSSWKARVDSTLHSLCASMDFHVSFVNLDSAMTFIEQLCSASVDDKAAFKSTCPGASGGYFKHFSDLVYSMASKPTITSHLGGGKLWQSITFKAVTKEERSFLNHLCHWRQHTGLTWFPAEMQSIRHHAIKKPGVFLIGGNLEVQSMWNVEHSYNMKYNMKGCAPLVLRVLAWPKYNGLIAFYWM